MRKIKWINVVKALVFVFSISMILYDMYKLTIGSWITGELYGWTGLGFTTFILFCWIACSIYEDFEMQLKKVPSERHQYK